MGLHLMLLIAFSNFVIEMKRKIIYEFYTFTVQLVERIGSRIDGSLCFFILFSKPSLGHIRF